MFKQIVFHPDVAEDIKGAYLWYEKQLLGLGDRFLLELEDGYIAIINFPNSWANFQYGFKRYISKIPDEIEKVNIFYLDISNNPIKTLPEIIYKKKRISNLLLHNTNIQNIPEDICQLKNLATLTFDDKHLPTIVKYLSYFPNIDSINLTHSNYDETSSLIQNLNLKYDKKEWLNKEHKKTNGVIKIFEESKFTPEDDMESMVKYGLSVVNEEPEEALRMYHEVMDLYEENNRKYPLPAETIDLSIAIVLNIAKIDIQQAINLLEIIEVEEFRVETIDNLIAMTDDEYYKVVLKGMKEGFKNE